jgi:general secretion pathway protein L
VVVKNQGRAFLADALVVRLPVSAGIAGSSASDTSFSFLRVAHDKVVQRGRSTLRDLPRARTTVLLLPAEDVLLLERDIPPLNERRLRAALPAMIEDATFADISTLHVAAGAPRGTARLLAVVDRSVLKRWLDLFEENGRIVTHAWCEALCLPHQPGSWSLATRSDRPGHSAVLRHAPGGVLTLTGAASDDALVMLAAKREAAPMDVVLFGERDALLPFEAMLARQQLSTRRGGTDGLTEFIEGDKVPPLDLLQGEFVRGLSLSSLRTWQTLAALIVLALLIETIGLGWQSSRLEAEKNRLVLDQAHILKRAFPETTTILDAPTQMRRALDSLQQHAGRSSAEDFETQLTRAGTLLAGLPPNVCTEMHFDNTALLMHLKAPQLAESASQAQLIKAAQAQGDTATFAPMGGDGDLTLRLVPRNAP